MVALTVFIITYNHEKFIGECLDGVLNQTTVYDYNILVSDDCSTDNTQKILKAYQEKYPKKIKLILRNKNVGGRINIIEGLYLIKDCNYIATLDGDDIWYDGKIQKQINFLENNLQVAVCHHNMKSVNEDRSRVLGNYNTTIQKKYTTLNDLISKGNYVCNSSKMFRANTIPNIGFKYKEKYIRSLDVIILVQLVRKQKIGYINIVLGEHRKHPGGGSYNVTDNLIWKYRGGLYAVYLSKKYINYSSFEKGKNRIYLKFSHRYFQAHEIVKSTLLMNKVSLGYITPKYWIIYFILKVQILVHKVFFLMKK